MIHSDSVIDMEFQVQTSREFNHIQYELMVVSPKREWLLTTALAHRIQHTERRNDLNVTMILPEYASVGRPLFEFCRQFELCVSHRLVVKTPRQPTRYGSGLPATPARRFSIVISIMRRRVRSDALPRCGVSTKFCIVSNG